MKFLKNSFHFYKVITRLIFSYSFLNVTIFGNLIIVGSSALFYMLEEGINENLNSMLDAIWWGFATATTVGYGDIIPITDKGKILGIFLMLIGAALLATYTAIFAQTIIEDDILNLKLTKDKLSNLELEKLLIEKKNIDSQIESLIKK